MQLFGLILGIAYPIALIALGVTDWPLWTPFIGAIIGVGAYHLVRPQIWNFYAEEHPKRLLSIAWLLGGLYITQLLLAFALYGAGRGAGYLWQTYTGQ